jgi:branched-chain amino acid aminotransferase
MTRYAYFEGAFVPIEQAQISIMANAFNYGTGCFEGIRAYWNAEEEQLFIFRVLEHYQRLLRSAHVLFMDLGLSAAELTELTCELLRMEGFREDAYIRPLAYKSTPGIGVRLHGLDDRLAIFSVPFGEYIQASDGAKAGVSSWRRIDDNAMPARAKITGAYVNSAFAKSEANLHGYDEAIVLTQDGHVSEGSAENIFLVKDGRLVTPPVSDNILEGITRQTVIQIASAELGIATDERQIDRSELYVADEVFFCGTGVQIVPVVEIDQRRIGDGVMGPMVRRVRDLYFDVVRGIAPRYRHWCTPVYPD